MDDASPDSNSSHRRVGNIELPNTSASDPAGAGPSGLTVLVDDARTFRDGRAALLARSSQDALHLLGVLSGTRIDDLWLDHDLIGQDTAWPVVEFLTRRAEEGAALPVTQIHVHTANVRAGHRMVTTLAKAGYPVKRSFHARMWVRLSAAVFVSTVLAVGGHGC